MSRTADLYRTFVVDHQLERIGLFALLRKRFDEVRTVLYPGCFLHVTPSFSFQHVVYVDRNELARDFFADTEGIQRLISAKQQYRQSPYVRFIEHDYTLPLPVPDASFDMLFALYAGGISRPCRRYLKPGGLLLSNDHHGDAREAANEKDLELVAVVMERGENFELFDQGLEGYLVPKEAGRSRARAQQGLGRPEYVRSADYYLFRKLRPL